MSSLVGRFFLAGLWPDLCELSIVYKVTDLVRRLELRRGSGEKEVQQGAVGDQVPHGWTAGYQLAGLK